MKSSGLKATALTAALSTAILLALFVAACDNDSPSGPGPLPPTASPGVVRLELTGPASLPPGGEEQFRATAHFSNGSQREVTTESAWTSANGSIVSVSTTGLASGRDRGETDIRAAFSQVISTRRVMVLPPGTFKLSGELHDGPLRVIDARVEVTAGSAAGLSTLSQDGGRYALYGVSGQTQIRATKDGYHPGVTSVNVTDHRTVNFALALLAPPWDPSGTYTLTIAAASECRTALPEDARVRTYRAVLALRPTNARYVSVKLDGAGEVQFDPQFWSGEIRESSVYFSGAYPLFDYGPPVVERLSSSRFFFVDAGDWWPEAVVSRTPAGLDGSYVGTLAIGEGDVWSNASLTAQCRSASHRLTFSR